MEKDLDDGMKIAMYGHKRIPSREGGVEIVVEELAVRMATKGNKVTCYNRRGRHVSGKEFDDKKLKEYKGVRIKRVWTIPKKGLAAMTSSLSAAILCAFHSYDVVHVHAEGPAATCLIPKLFGKRVIVTIHGLDWQRAKWGGFAAKYIKWGEKQAAKHADNIIVLSRDAQNYFRKEYQRETIFIPNGVNKPNVRVAEKIKELWNLEKDSYVLFLGRIVPEKGIRYLIEAWKDVATDKRLVIVGGSSDTEAYVEELKGIADKDVLFTGFQQGEILEELYSNAYLYCLPSDLEGMPLSLLEAMSYGNCCVVSDIAECMEIVGNKAISFPKGDVGALRQTLQKLLDNKDIVAQYKEDAAQYVLEKYDWDKVVEQTLMTYE